MPSETAGTMTGTDAAQYTFSAPPAKRPAGTLNVRVEVAQDGALTLIPEDTLAAFVLQSVGYRVRVAHSGKAHTPERGQYQFESVTFIPNNGPRLLRGQETFWDRGVEQGHALSPAQLAACEALLEQPNDAAPRPRNKRRRKA